MTDANDQDLFNWDDTDEALGGGLLPTYQGIIRDPSFGIDGNYNEDTLRFMWDIEVTVQEDDEHDIDAGHIFHEAVNVGPTSTWEALDGGNAVERVDGRKAKVSAQSGLGRLIGAIGGGHYGDEDKTKLEGADEVRKILKDRKSGPFQASTWSDLEFVWERLSFSFHNNKTNEDVDYERPYPVKFVGVVDAADPRETSKSNGAVPSDQIDDVRDGLVDMAKGYDTHQAFLAMAIQTYPSLSTMAPNVFKEVMDKDGIYAEAQG